MRIPHACLAAGLAAAFAIGPALAADPPPVPYPAGYRTWAHVKTMQILPGHPLHDAFGGVHHLYANRAAMDGYRRGRFPDGAVIVFDLAEALSADHTVVDGPRKVVVHPDRNGYVYVLDRGTGEVISAEPFHYVTTSTDRNSVV